MERKTILQLLITPIAGFFLAAIVAGILEAMGYTKIEFASFEMLALWGGASAVVYYALEKWWFSRTS